MAKELNKQPERRRRRNDILHNIHTDIIPYTIIAAAFLNNNQEKEREKLFFLAEVVASQAGLFSRKRSHMTLTRIGDNEKMFSSDSVSSLWS